PARGSGGDVARGTLRCYRATRSFANDGLEDSRDRVADRKRAAFCEAHRVDLRRSAAIGGVEDDRIATRPGRRRLHTVAAAEHLKLASDAVEDDDFRDA